MSNKEEKGSPTTSGIRALCVGVGSTDGEVLAIISVTKDDINITFSMSPSTARVYADALWSVAAEIEAIKARSEVPS